MATLFTDHTYKRYCLGSTAVVQWLWLNAERCSPKAVRTTKSAKDRAKKKAKKIPAKTTVSIDEYLGLAKTIADSTEPLIEVPAWVLHNLRHMMKIRRILAKQFAATETKDSCSTAEDSSDGLHESSSDTIQSVLDGVQESSSYVTPDLSHGVQSSDSIQDTLDSVQEGSSYATPATSDGVRESSSDTQDTSDAVQESSNRSNLHVLKDVFDLLKSKQLKDGFAPSTLLFSTAHTIIYLSDYPYQRLFPAEPVKAGQNWQKESAPKCALQPLKDEEDRMLMVQCLFEDFAAIRKYIRESWEAYSQHQADLYMVAAATNTAIAVLQGMVKEVEDSFLPEIFQYERFLPLAAQWMNSSKEVFYPFFAQDEQQIESSVWNIADRICLPAHAILENWYLYTNKSYKSSPLSRRKPLPPVGDTPAEKFTHAKHILNHFLGEVAFVKSYKKGHIPIADNLTLGLWDRFEKDKTDTWIPFACTIHLDICGALGEKLDMGQMDLMKSCQRLHRTIDDFWRSPEQFLLAPEHIPPPKKDTKAAQKESETRVYNWTSVHLDQDPAPVPIDRHVSMIIDLLTSIVDIEEDLIAEARPKVLSHMRVKNPEYPRYHLLNIHPLFCGVLEFQFMLRMQDASIEAANNWGSIVSVAWLYRALGEELTHSCKPAWHDMETVLALHNEQFWPEPKNVAEILSRFEGLTGFSEAAEFWKPVPRAVQPSTFLQPKSACHILLYDHYASEEGSKKELSMATFHDKWEWTQSLCLTPELILAELSKCLKLEFDSLKFNYLSMHIRCMKLLSKIHLQLDDKFSERFGTGYIQRPTQLPFLTAYLLTDFTMHDSVRKLRNEKQRKAFRGEFSIESNEDEEYESPNGNNEVTDYESVISGENPFEDFSSRHPEAANMVPLIFYEAGRIVDEVIEEEGEWEHQDLIRVKDDVLNAEWLSEHWQKLTDKEEARGLTLQWVMCVRAALDRADKEKA